MTSAAILFSSVTPAHGGRAIIFSTHYMSEAEMLCDRVGLLHKGILFARGQQGRAVRAKPARRICAPRSSNSWRKRARTPMKTRTVTTILRKELLDMFREQADRCS